MQNITLDIIKSIDSQNMYQLLKDYWIHIENAINAAQKSKAVFDAPATDIVILGIGGSAISGELLRSYIKKLNFKKEVRIRIIRGNEIPDNIDMNTCVFVSSYSGNTEETLSALEIVKKKTKNLIAITSGGKLEEMFVSQKLPILKLPGGMMPRCSLAYSFFHLIYVLVRQNIIEDSFIYGAVQELLARKNNEDFDFSHIDNNNIAIDIAKKFTNKIPIIYSSELMQAVNLRWRAQIQENANSISFGNIFPEANHNEINGWNYPKDLLDRFYFLFLLEKEDNLTAQRSMELARTILEEENIATMELEGNGKHFLTRMFDLICISDWTSFYLAIIYDVDPTTIPTITKLKALASR